MYCACDLEDHEQDAPFDCTHCDEAEFLDVDDDLFDEDAGA